MKKNKNNSAQFENSDLSNQPYYTTSKNSKSKKKIRRLLPTKRPVEEIGLVPRSIIRTFSRFVKQMFFETTDLVVQEFRISRYQVLVSIQCLFLLIFIPLLTNILATNFIFKPLTEYFWNANQNEIFLNSYQQNRAFLEMQQFENQLYFEVLLNSEIEQKSELKNQLGEASLNKTSLNILNKQTFSQNTQNPKKFNENQLNQLGEAQLYTIDCEPIDLSTNSFQLRKLLLTESNPKLSELDLNKFNPWNPFKETSMEPNQNSNSIFIQSIEELEKFSFAQSRSKDNCAKRNDNNDQIRFSSINEFSEIKDEPVNSHSISQYNINQFSNASDMLQNSIVFFPKNEPNSINFTQNINSSVKNDNSESNNSINVFTQEFSRRVQQKTLELAFEYNQQSINALNNLFGDLITLMTLFLLFLGLKPQIIILKSFLLESLYSLSDTTKSFLLILGTDLLVGFHSPRGWEVFIDFILNRFGFPHNENFIFLFVATFPVLLDTVFKYWIFRYLNKISPSTVATYHAMIE